MYIFQNSTFIEKQMKTTQKDVLLELNVVTTRIIESVQSYTLLDDTILFQRLASQKWSITECLEHLNLYGDFYIPVIQEFISKNSGTQTQHFFHPGFW